MPYATKSGQSTKVLPLTTSTKNFSSFLQNIFKKFSSFFPIREKNASKLSDSYFNSPAIEYHVLLNDKIDPFLEVQIHLN